MTTVCQRNDSSVSPEFSRRTVIARGARLLTAWTAAAAAGLGGCQSTPAGRARRVPGGGGAAIGQGVSADAGGGGGTTPVAPITNTDECATRLHDLCEPLLL